MKTDNQIKESFDKMLEENHPEFKRMKEALKVIKHSFNNTYEVDPFLEVVREQLSSVDDVIN